MDLLSFSNNEYGQIRAIIIDGKPWFVTKDICDVLDIKNPSRTLARLEKKEKRYYTMKTPGGTQNMSIVSESGAYAIIFLSRKETAKNFRIWVTEEVLPSIRKTGAYSLAKPDSYMIENPKERALRWVEEYEEKLALENRIKEQGKLIEEQDKFITEQEEIIFDQKTTLAKQKPIVDFGERLIENETEWHSIGDAAKMLHFPNLGQNKLFQFLRNVGDLIMDGKRKNHPYQRFINKGYYRVLRKEYMDENKDCMCIKYKTQVSNKGLEHITRLYKKYRS